MLSLSLPPYEKDHLSEQKCSLSQESKTLSHNRAFFMYSFSVIYRSETIWPKRDIWGSNRGGEQQHEVKKKKVGGVHKRIAERHV